MGTDESSEDRKPYLPTWPEEPGGLGPDRWSASGESHPDSRPASQGDNRLDSRTDNGRKGTVTGLFGSGSRRPAGGDTPTVISSLGDVKKPDPEATTALVIGALGLVVAGAAFLARRRTRRKLRQPTKRQSRDIAEPLARIMLRHADPSLLNPDLADVIAAGGAFGAYLNDGDLFEGSAIDSGVPAGLNQEETPS